jgi:hypothetical protein
VLFVSICFRWKEIVVCGRKFVGGIWWNSVVCFDLISRVTRSTSPLHTPPASCIDAEELLSPKKVDVVVADFLRRRRWQHSQLTDRGPAKIQSYLILVVKGLNSPMVDQCVDLDCDLGLL